jgi:hypothetical protein
MFLYDLPNPVLGGAVIAFTIALCLSGYAVMRRLLRPAVTDEQRSLALAVLPIVATVHSLLLAFSAVSVWESYSAAEYSVVQEANIIGEMARDLAVFNSAESLRAREALKDYAQTVVRDEWAVMREGGSNPLAWDKFDNVFRAVGAMHPDTPQRVALMPEVWQKTNTLVELRRDRIHASEAEIPSTLWTVVLIGTILTMLTTVVLPPTRFNVAMIAMLACSVGLVFFFLVAMDRPFAGRESISPEPFISAIANIDRWDASASR